MHDRSTIESGKNSRKTRSKLVSKQICIGADLFGQHVFVYRRIQKSENAVSKPQTKEFEAKKPVFVGYDLHIQPNSICAIAAFTDNSFRGGACNEKSKKNLQCNRVKGELSKASRKKLNRSVNWLVAAARPIKVWSKQKKQHYKFKCAFITLTLPSKQGDISDYHFKKYMLQKFIDWMRKTKAVKNYIWKVEAQANGNIHAHIVVNQFIHYKDVRREWLKICREQGLVVQKDESKVPCTEVKAVRNVKKLGAYVAKYLGKNDESRRAITGRLWACNYELSSANKLVVRADSFDTDGLVQWWNNKAIRRAAIEVKGKLKGSTKTIGYYAELSAKLWRQVVCDELEELYKSHLWNIRTHMQMLPLSYYQV